jgi:hypothetical protein
LVLDGGNAGVDNLAIGCADSGSGDLSQLERHHKVNQSQASRSYLGYPPTRYPPTRYPQPSYPQLASIIDLNAPPRLIVAGECGLLAGDQHPAAFTSLPALLRWWTGHSEGKKFSAPVSIINVPTSMGVLVVWHPYDNNQVTDAILYMQPRQVMQWAFLCFGQLQVMDVNRGPIVEAGAAQAAGMQYIAVIADDGVYSRPTVYSCYFKAPTNRNTFQPLTM